MSTEKRKKRSIFLSLEEEIASREKEDERLAPDALLSLPGELRELMLHLARLGEMTADQLARELGQHRAEVEKMLSTLVEKGYLTEEKTYRPTSGRRSTSRLLQSIWESLEKRV